MAAESASLVLSDVRPNRAVAVAAGSVLLVEAVIGSHDEGFARAAAMVRNFMALALGPLLGGVESEADLRRIVLNACRGAFTDDDVRDAGGFKLSIGARVHDDWIFCNVGPHQVILVRAGLPVPLLRGDTIASATGLLEDSAEFHTLGGIATKLATADVDTSDLQTVRTHLEPNDLIVIVAAPWLAANALNGTHSAGAIRECLEQYCAKYYRGIAGPSYVCLTGAS